MHTNNYNVQTHGSQADPAAVIADLVRRVSILEQTAATGESTGDTFVTTGAKATLDEACVNIALLQAAVTTIKADVKDVKADVQGIKADIDEIKGRLTVLEYRAGKLEARMLNVELSLDGLAKEARKTNDGIRALGRHLGISVFED